MTNQSPVLSSVYPEPAHRPAVEAARRTQILAAARACIAAKGYDATTIRDVALAGGVSTGTINYYFSGKEALLIAALEDLARDFGHHVRAAADQSHGDAFAGLTAIIETSLPLPDMAPRNWYLWLEFWGQAYRNPALGRIHADLYRGWRKLIARTITRGIAAGQFQAVDAAAVARQLAGLIDGLALHCMVGDPELPAQEVRTLCLSFLRTVLQPRSEAVHAE